MHIYEIAHVVGLQIDVITPIQVRVNEFMAHRTIVPTGTRVVAGGLYPDRPAFITRKFPETWVS